MIFMKLLLSTLVPLWHTVACSPGDRHTGIQTLPRTAAGAQGRG